MAVTKRTIPVYRTSDGKDHTNLDQALKAEQAVQLENVLESDHMICWRDCCPSEIAQLLLKNYEKVVGILTSDIEVVVQAPSRTGDDIEELDLV